MKVELQCGDTITIPEGCKAIVKDGSVVFEKEEQTEEKKEEQEFKDGDVLIPIAEGHRYYAFIYKGTDDEGFHSYYVGIDVLGALSFSESPSDRWSDYDLVHATEEEKQLLFYTLKDNGYQWNAEEKRVEKIRWRAKYGEKYFVVRMDGGIYSSEENNDEYDDSYYNAFNYFRTEEQDKEAARRVKETLRKYHEEIGE